MANQSEREYKMEIDPKILRLLGPNLYSNIYYVLAELISNAYDADASNVYIISEPGRIIVEDDGVGMTYDRGVKKYLHVAEETRTSAEDSYSRNGRRKMGRKGVGKLSALSVSERVLVKTKSSGEKSGFILSRELRQDGVLEPLVDAEITFQKVLEDHGTAIVMENPRYVLNKTMGSVKNNLLKIFPLVNEEFRIHIIADGKEEIVDSFDKEMISQLGGLILLGSEFASFSTYFKNDYPDKKEQLMLVEDGHEIDLLLNNKAGEQKSYKLVINGWIGAYKTTADRKKGYEDFPDNFVSLFANKKLGEYNILPLTGKNKLIEVFIVGQLHVDLFEETELPDMALSNRQGYKNDDPRYGAVIDYVRDTLIERVLGLRKRYVDYRDEIKNQRKFDEQKRKEEALISKVDEFKRSMRERGAHKIADLFVGKVPGQEEAIGSILDAEANALLPIIGLKSAADALKKRILISHTKDDKILGDVIYKMLVFNNVPPEDIIYTNCEDEASRLPNSADIFEYLRRFFVESYSKQGIYVVYVTSKKMSSSWGAPVEAGAGWIVKVEHQIFNIEKDDEDADGRDHKPQEPLNTRKDWHTSRKSNGQLFVESVEFDKFVVKIGEICDWLGYSKKSREDNKAELNKYFVVS